MPPLNPSGVTVSEVHLFVFLRLWACVVLRFGASPRHVLIAAQNGYIASTLKNPKTGGSDIGALERLIAQGSTENETGIPISSAVGDAALAACRLDHRYVDRRVFLARGDAQLRPSENRRSARAHGRRHANPGLDGHPLHRANANS